MPPQGLPCSLEGAVRRRHRQAEGRGRLGRGPAEHVAQHDHRPLAGRQHLQGGQVRELDRLALERRCLGPGAAGLQVVEQPVGIRLHPRHGGQRRWARAGCVGLGAGGGHQPRPAALGPQEVQAHVGGDAVQPRAERPRSAGRAGGARGIECGAPRPRPHDRLLDEVVGIVDRTNEPVAVDVQLRSVAADRVVERPGVAGDRRADHRVGVRSGHTPAGAGGDTPSGR